MGRQSLLTAFRQVGDKNLSRCMFSLRLPRFPSERRSSVIPRRKRVCSGPRTHTRTARLCTACEQRRFPGLSHPGMGQTQTVFLPPWEPTTEAEKARADEFRTAIRELSSHAANLLTPHAVHTEPDFSFDWVEHRSFAEAAYTGDAKLGRLIPRLVPKQCARRPTPRLARPLLRPQPTALLARLGPKLTCTGVRTACPRRTSGATTSPTSTQ